jgi:lipid-A-disaccharide synthase
MRFALIAGEASGDLLGAALIAALRQRFPDAQFVGLAGPRMRAVGCEALGGIEQLSVMGIGEVLPKLPAILRLRRFLYRTLRAQRPDCVIGIDAPDFNLGLERQLRQRGIPTVHMVSPTIWAWRQGRVKKIAQAADLILCLFPFEPQFYAGHGVDARYIGHPLAEELAAPIAREAARAQLGLPMNAPCVAVLPGSRGVELKYLAASFAATAAWLANRVENICFVTPIAKPSLRAVMAQAMAEHAPGLRWQLCEGQSRAAMRAADAVLLASGTATLECLLLDRPMVVGYRLSAITAWLLGTAGMLKIRKVSLPNLLSAEPVVPEFLQDAVTAENLGPAVLALLTDPAARQRQLAQFGAVRTELKRDAAENAAAAIAQLLGR